MPQHQIIIHRSDDFPIAATIFTPENARAAIMIAPATGIKRQFYQAFANFLCEQGYAVITFDNEGIGESQNTKIKHSKASLIRWGQLDMSAVFATLREKFPDLPYHLIGHSAGGQLVGLMDEAPRLTSIFNVACSSGWLRNMRPAFKLRAHFFMNVFIPSNNLLLGYTNAPLVGMGEPLPRQVAQQWRQWCNRGGYIRDYLAQEQPQHHYHQLACPALWLNATDDDIACEKNLDDFLPNFPLLKSQKRIISPQEFGFKSIGHMKFFSRQYSPLWQIAIDWLQSHQ